MNVKYVSMKKTRGKMKTYLMLHPSSRAIIDVIFKKLKEQNFKIEDVFVVRDWGEKIIKIYSHDFHRFKFFQDHVEAHICINNYFFGENGLLLILDKNVDFLTLANQTIALKKEIRELAKKTRDGTISMLVDINKITEEKRGNNGTISLIKNGEIQDFETTMIQEGRIMSVYFTYLHCPDAEINCYERDYKILAENMTSKNRLTESEICDVIKFKSYEIGR